jgi:hypothetical protein
VGAAGWGDGRGQPIVTCGVPAAAAPQGRTAQVSDDSDPAREAIHEAIQAHAPSGRKAILTGWVMVAEWMDPEGDRWLSRAHAASTTSWAANGMHHEVLHGDGWDAAD